METQHKLVTVETLTYELFMLLQGSKKSFFESVDCHTGDVDFISSKRDFIIKLMGLRIESIGFDSDYNLEICMSKEGNPKIESLSELTLIGAINSLRRFKVIVGLSDDNAWVLVS